MKAEFLSLGNGGHYSKAQKACAFRAIEEYGIRATSRILLVQRRTLQRWCRQNDIYVKRCPSWVLEWAAKRRKRQEFWRGKGYFQNI